MIFGILANLFSPIFNLVNVDTRFIIPILSGFIELTSGINLISLLHTPKLGISIIIIAFLLGFAGISILLQVWSIASKTDISIKPYFLGKLLQGIFAAFYTFIIISNFDFLLLIDKKINLNLLYTYYNLFSIFKNRVRIRTRKR